MDMNTDRDELAAFVDAAAEVLDIPIDPTWKPAVRENLSVIFAHARRFADFPLPDEAEPAPVFRA
jgi:hypothetical protein